jgi:hypothetical protein
MGDVLELVVFARKDALFLLGDHAHLCSGRKLPIDPWFAAGDMQTDIPIDFPDKMVDVFNSLVERGVGILVKGRFSAFQDEKSFIISPVIIELLDELM